MHVYQIFAFVSHSVCCIVLEINYSTSQQPSSFLYNFDKKKYINMMVNQPEINVNWVILPSDLVEVCRTNSKIYPDVFASYII